MKKRAREEDESKVEDTLPPHWIARKSRTHNKWFYYNSVSGFKTWTHPSKLLEKEILKHKEETERKILITARTTQPKEKRRMRYFSSPRQPDSYSSESDGGIMSSSNRTITSESVEATPTKPPPPSD